MTRTERGWPGHCCYAAKCTFRRNTLLEHDRTRVVVSTVGRRTDGDEIGSGRHYETMAFHAYQEFEGYWDADVSRPVAFPGAQGMPWCGLPSDQLANEMHEAVVEEISKRLIRGKHD